MHFLRDCKQITSSFVVFSLSKKKWYIFSSFLEKAHAKLIDSVLWLVHILQAKCKLGWWENWVQSRKRISSLSDLIPINECLLCSTDCHATMWIYVILLSLLRLLQNLNGKKSRFPPSPKKKKKKSHVLVILWQETYKGRQFSTTLQIFVFIHKEVIPWAVILSHLLWSSLSKFFTGHSNLGFSQRKGRSIIWNQENLDYICF